MADWFTADSLRSAAGAKQPFDQGKFELAAAVARRRVRFLCGPVSPVENITERVRVKVPTENVMLKYRPSLLASVTSYRTGQALTVADYDFEDQLLFRKDDGLIDESLTVVYASGYAGTTEDPVPDELTSMATLIAHQYLRVSRRFTLTGGEEDLSQTHFMTPTVARDVARDFLLTDGVG